MLVLGPLRSHSFAGQGQTLPVTGLELPTSSYKMIHDWLLLDLEVCGRGHAGNQGQLSPIPGLGQLSKRPKAPKACHHLPAVHKALPLTKCLVVQELGGVGSQGVTSLRQVVFNRLMQIQI